MNYEKKYNEALERFKSFKEKYYTYDKTCFIFWKVRRSNDLHRDSGQT